MEIETIHKSIFSKLDFFIENKKIPHIIFHGNYGCGKRTILNKFILKLYHNSYDYINQYVMYVNCSHGKGIRFFRDQLKFFAKTNILNKKYEIFKSIILFNADKLTIDAQSALRRCIEKYSHTTRFFIIAENKSNLLKPILSRFCCIFIPKPFYNNEYISFNTYNKSLNNDNLDKKNEWLIKNIKLKKNYKTLKECSDFSLKLYEKGYSALDIINYIDLHINKKKFVKDKSLLLMYFDKIRKNFRNEKILIFNILYFTFMRKKIDLENILTM